MHQYKKSFLFLGLIFTLKAFAAPYSDLPGSVPLVDERQAASDLVYNGKLLQPDEARTLVRSGTVKDLSMLNPMDDSILWKDQYPKTIEDDYAALELRPEGEEVEFITRDSAPNGRAIFIAQKRFADGRLRTYRFILDDKGHNMLARKVLLRKIGYQVPPMERIAVLRVKFKGAFSKREYLNKNKREIVKEGDRWVTSDPASDDPYLTFQDLIVLPDSIDWYYNLARGNLVGGVIQGRRLINSLLIPYTLTDAPESLNRMNWTGAQVFNEQLLFPYELAQLFNPSLDDARWIMRRILNLKEQDWAEIAEGARMPTEARLVFLEKLKSRTNYAAELLLVTPPGPALSVQKNISSGERLVDGKLIGREWPGYARRFAGTDPDSPLAVDELVALFGSKVFSNVIDYLVSQFNTRYAPRTDLGFKIFDHQIDVAAKQFAEFLTTGKVSKTPVGLWKTPFYDTQLIASREIVTGNYLGATNIVQLADSLGFSVQGGMFYLVEGLSEKLAASLTAKVQVVITYTHLKPVKSIKASLSEPLSNIIVPAHRAQAIEPLEKMMALEERIQNKEFESENSKERKMLQDKLKAEIKQNFDDLAKSLGPGESYITYVALAPSIGLNIGRGITSDAQAYLQLQDQLMGVYRLQIYRANETEVQVYMDLAGYNQLVTTLGAILKIPIADISLNWPKGKARTHFFSFDLDSNLERNRNFFDNINGVIAAIKGTTNEFLSTIKKPWLFEQNFENFTLNLNLLVWKNAKSSTTNVITATKPDGEVGHYIRRLLAERSGIQYEDLLLSVANAIILEKFPDSGVHLSSTTSGNPGDTVGGKALTRQTLSEVRVVKESLNLDNVYANVGYRWKGWKAKISSIYKILDEIDKHYGEKLFERKLLHDTKAIELYNIEIQTSLYREAFEHILRLDDKTILDIFKRYGRRSTAIGEGTDYESVSSWANLILYELKKMRFSLATNNGPDFADYLASVIDMAESQLEFQGFLEFIGGRNNFFVQGTIKGFRVNSEGQEDLRSVTLGRIGGQEPLGPLYALQKESGVSGGELYLQWIINPL